MKKIIFLVCVSTLLCLTNANAWSISKLEGEAMISRAGELIPAEEGLPLVSLDVVSTQQNSRILIVKADNKIWLSSNTKFKIGSIDQARGKSPSQTLNLLYGKLRSAVKKKADKRVQLKFKTRTAVAGVRGTEFFIESVDSGEFFCTLDGSIEVATSEGESFVVDEGNGLRLAKGDVPSLSGTPSKLVDRWVAETSFERPYYSPESQYDIKKHKHQWDSKDIYYGAYGWVFYCGSKNTDFDDSASDSKMECYRFYASPYVQLGKDRKLFFRPAVVGVNTDSSSGRIDFVPSKTGSSETAVTVAEAYYEDSYWGLRFKLGLQEIHWTDGAILSVQQSTNEPQTHLALRITGDIGHWEVEFLGGPGLEDDEPLMGHTHIQTLGIKTKAPKNRGELFVLHTDFDDIGSNPVALAHQYLGHEVLNAGYYVSNSHKSWDYSLSYIYQDHKEHHDTTNSKGDAQADMVDVKIGHQLKLARAARVSLGWNKSSRNYVPVLEDYYAISNSSVFLRRNNIEQYRARLEMQITEGQRAYVEYMLNSQVSNNGFYNDLANKGDSLATEMAISHSWKINSQWKWNNTFWQINPESVLGKDSAHGLNSRLSFSL